MYILKADCCKINHWNFMVKSVRLKPFASKLLILLLLNVFSFCGGSTKESGEPIAPIPPRPQDVDAFGNPKFFSAENPGPWGEQKDTHKVIISVIKKKDHYRVIISSPFKTDHGHHIELFAITDYLGREIAKQSLERYAKPRAEFQLPLELRGTFYAIMKCNLHDMWRESFVLE